MPAGFSTDNNEHLIRSQLWTGQIKDFLEDDLFATTYIDWITDFGDGDTLNIPSIGQMEARDYEEGQAVTYTGMDTGNFQFSVTEYKQSGTFITNKMKQDSFYMGRLMSTFVPRQARAIAKVMEIDCLRVGPEAQTASNTNTINGAYHRYVGSGANETISVVDFAKARYALAKANVPLTNLVAIVDPSVEFQLATLANLTNLSFNPRWEGIVTSGISTGMKFMVNIYGFDVYVSQNLKSGIAETVDSLSVTTGVANLFFSATSDVLPIVGAVRQAPKVDSKYNMDFQREEYVTTTRYGMKLFRPENLVVVLTDDDQVYA
jgi:hypothetical protein